MNNHGLDDFNTTPKRNMPLSRLWLGIASIAIVISLGSGTHAGWIYGKAAVAQLLLENAWRKSLVVAAPHRPWSWADIRTVARLDIVDTNKSFIVLSDASGEAMAFGPGLVGGNTLKATQNTIAIGGHRDTHLSFLEHLPIGAHINLQNAAGLFLRYELVDKTVLDSRSQSIKISKTTPGLVLITCYPFNTRQTGGPYRLVAKAKLLTS
ncbi:MAG: sortase A [Granulosicoccus sp.]|jgi:sortase A